MARRYGRRRYRRRRSYRRRRGRGGVMSRVARMVRRMVPKPELKKQYAGMSGVFSSVSNTPVHMYLTTIGRGTSASERIGNKLRLKNLIVNAILAPADAYNIVRVMVYWAPAAFTTTSLTSNGTFTPRHAIIAQDYPGTNPRILYDRRFVMQTSQWYTGGTGYQYAAPAGRRLSFKINLRNRLVKYDLTDALDTPSNGQLIITMYSDSTAVSHPGIRAEEGYVILNYYDN